MNKPIEFLGTALEDLRAFPQGVKRELGFQLDRVQRGLEPEDWKPMKTIGPGVKELRVRDAAGAFRAVYVAKFEAAIYGDFRKIICRWMAVEWRALQ